MQKLRRVLERFGLGEQITFGRPDLPTLVTKLMHTHLRFGMRTPQLDRPRHRTLLTFCGSKHVANLARKGAAQANVLAAAAGHAGFRMDFRAEDYAVAAGRQRKAAHTGKANRHGWPVRVGPATSTAGSDLAEEAQTQSPPPTPRVTAKEAPAGGATAAPSTPEAAAAAGALVVEDCEQRK